MSVDNEIKTSTTEKIKSAAKLYTFFPISIAFNSSTKLLSLKHDPNAATWKKLITNNIITRAMTAFAMVMSINQGIQQTTGLTFETVEDYLKKTGYPNTIISDFSDANIRVRPRTLYGTIHTAHDMPPLIAIIANLAHNRISNDALPTGSKGLGTLLSTNKYLKIIRPYVQDYLSRFVTLPKEDATSKEIITQLGEIPEELLDSLEINDEMLRQAMTLYMLRRMDTHHDTKTFESKKAEAYIYAFESVANMHNAHNFAALAL